MAADFVNEFFNIGPIWATVVVIILLFFVLGKIAAALVMPLIKGLVIGGVIGGILAALGFQAEFCLIVAVILFFASAVFDLLKVVFGKGAS